MIQSQVSESTYLLTTPVKFDDVIVSIYKQKLNKTCQVRPVRLRDVIET